MAEWTGVGDRRMLIRRYRDALSAALRHGEPSVFSRIADDALLLDPRTLLEGDLERLLNALRVIEA